MATVQTARLELATGAANVQTSRMALEVTLPPAVVQTSRMELVAVASPLQYRAIGGSWVGVTANKRATGGVWA